MTVARGGGAGDGPRAVVAGVAGVGRLGREHTRLLATLPGAELVGVHDADGARGEGVGAEFGVPHFDELGELLDRVEALVVAVPTRDHHAVARKALSAGCHALVEKPLAPTLEEADDLIRRAEASGLQLGVGHVERFNGAVRASGEHLDSPRFIECQRLSPFRARGVDVNVVLDLMIHDIDLVLGLVASEVTSLHAVGTPVLTDAIDIANARLVFGDGTVAEVTASRVSEERTRVLRFFQTSGYISLDLDQEAGAFLRRREPRPGGDAAEAGGAPDLYDIVERVPLRGDGREPLRLELESFLEAVRGRESPLVSAREGRAALDLALRISREVERFAHVSVETA